MVVDWDQRGAGKSYAALDPTSTLTPDQLISDTIELTDYLRQRFGAREDLPDREVLGHDHPCAFDVQDQTAVSFDDNQNNAPAFGLCPN